MKKILIVSQYIAPVRAIGSVRWTKIAKYIKYKHDVEISVLTNEKDYSKNGLFHYEIDNLLKDEMVLFDDYHTFSTGSKQETLIRIKNRIKREQRESVQPIVNVGASGSKRFAEPTMRHSINSLIQDIGTKEIVKDGYNYFKKKNKEYDVIISSYGPIWPHLLAEKIKNHYPNTLWVADFRDIYAGNPYETEKEFKRHRSFVGKHLRNANIITKVVEGLELFEKPEQNVVTLSNGFDWAERIIPAPPTKFSFVYTGSFYPKETNLLLIFQAIKELIEEKKILHEDIEITYAGRNGNEFADQADEMGLKQYVIDYGSVSREVAINLQKSAAVLLQSYTYSASFKSLWSGKMFEYMMAEKPIVFSVICDTSSEQYKLMPKLGGIAVESCNTKETFEPMKRYILEKYQEWKHTGNVSISRDDEYVKSFSYENIADEFWNLISED